MYFRSLLVVLVAPLLALAQQPNPFNIPTDGLSASAGTPLTLKWNPTTQGTVTLVLRSGSSNDLNKGTVIASSIANSGSYTWTPSNSITRGSDYAIEIVDDSDPSQTNYTPYFVIDTDNTVASATPTVTLGASQTSIKTQTGVKTSATSASSSSSASSGSMSSGSMSTSSGMTNTKTNGGMTTRTTGGSSPTNGGSSSATGASFQPTSQSATAATGAAPRATAAAGMLGLVALGALAL